MLTPKWPENLTDPPRLGEVPSSEWNDTDVPFQQNKTVIDFFAERVKATPDAIAVKDPSCFLSYAELDRLSNRVAVRLVKEGLRVEELVVLLMDRSCNFVIACVGVLKAGGSYLPLDIHCPLRRLALLLADSRARFVIG